MQVSNTTNAFAWFSNQGNPGMDLSNTIDQAPFPPPDQLGRPFSSGGVLNFDLQVIYPLSIEFLKKIEVLNLLAYLKSCILPDEVNHAPKVFQKTDIDLFDLPYNPFQEIQVYGVVQSRNHDQLIQAQTNLQKAAENDDPDSFSKVLEENNIGAMQSVPTAALLPVVMPIPRGYRPLDVAIEHQSCNILTDLKEQGVDFSKLSRLSRRTALSEAFTQDKPEAFKHLLTLGCNPDERTEYVDNGKKKVYKSVRERFQSKPGDPKYQKFAQILTQYEAQKGGPAD